MTIGDRVILVQQTPAGAERTNTTGTIVGQGVCEDSPGQSRWYKVRWDRSVNLDSPCWVHCTDIEAID